MYWYFQCTEFTTENSQNGVKYLGHQVRPDYEFISGIKYCFILWGPYERFYLIKLAQSMLNKLQNVIKAKSHMTIY